MEMIIQHALRVKWIGAVWILLLCFNDLAAQLQCVNYTSQNGLISDFTTCAVEDKDGYMWFGTAAGICKFDGHRFHDYSLEGKGEAPGVVMIVTLEVDNNSNIWLGTEKSGIYKLDRSTGEWSHFHQEGKGPRKLEGDEITFLKSTSDGLIWFGAQRTGLGCIFTEHDSITNYPIDHLENHGAWKGMLYDMKVDPVDTSLLWLSGHGSIMQFDKKTKKFNQYLPQNDENIRLEFQFFSILPDGSIYISTYQNGVYRIDRKRERATAINPPAFESGKKWNSRVVDFLDGKIWTAYKNQGIASYDVTSGDWSTYQSSAENYHGLLPGQIRNLYICKSGLKWVMTSNGISLIIPGRQRFGYFDKREENNFFLGATKDRITGNLLMAYAGNHGAFKVMNDDYDIKLSTNVPGRENRFNSVFSIYTFEDQHYLLSDQIYTFDGKTVALADWEGFSNTLSPISMHRDGLGHFWILNRQFSVTHYDPDQKEQHTYKFPHFNNQQSAKYIMHDMVAVGKELWIAAQSELAVLNTETHQIRYYIIDDTSIRKKTDPSAPIATSGTIAQVIPYSDSCVWILSTTAGFYKVCYASDGTSLELVDRKNGSDFPQLRNPFSIIKGSGQDYWIGTNDGIVHTNNDFTEFKLIHRSEGLSYTKINHGLSLVDGNLFVGLENGFAVANENQLHVSYPPQACHINEPKLGDVDLKGEMQKVKYSENALSAHLSTPIYDEPQSVEFAYRLNGASKEWTSIIGDNPPIRMDNLAPGNYTLEAKVRSRNREWGETTSLPFRIQPPYWKAGWFKILVALLIAGIAYLIYKLKLKQDLKDEKVKTQLAELQNQALRAQMNPHFIFNSLNSIKSLVLLDRKEEGITYLTKFSRMVREILNLSKENAISLEKELELLRIYLDMESLRFHQKFEYHIHIDPSVNLYQQLVPPLLIQPFAENSIWHGLMHKEADAHLEISVEEKAGFLHITIEDDGIGRKAAAQIKTNKSMYRKSSEGLKLSKSRIHLVSDHADVEIEDLSEGSKATGTRVTIKLPTNYGKEIESNINR